VFSAKREVVVMYKPQTIFYEGFEEAERRNSLVFTAREWKMLWISYCICVSVVLASLYLCVALAKPVRLDVDESLLRQPITTRAQAALRSENVVR